MAYKSWLRTLVVAVAASIMLSCSGLAEYEVVLLNGKILDINTGEFSLQNVGINEGAIEIITEENIKGLEVIDAQGSFIYPGFIDAHCHLVGYANSLMAVNLVGTKSMEEVVERIRKFQEEHADLSFIYGRGWDQNDWQNKELPTNELLNEAFGDKPVYLTRIDGHAALLNKKALELIDEVPETIDGGSVVRRGEELTGLLIDRAASLLRPPQLSKGQFLRAIKQAERNCFEQGLTGLADAGLDIRTIKHIDSLQQVGELKMPLYIMVSNNREDVQYLFSNGPIQTDLLKARSIKVYADGALGSRGALLMHPYSDSPEELGLMVTRTDEIEELCRQAAEKGIQINIHAIGDSANRVVLKVFSKILEPNNDFRWRVEHAQVVNKKDSTYYLTYNILPSVQPTHATSDMYWAEDRLGNERIGDAYSYADLLRWSQILPLGTDFPIEDISPLKTFYAAVARQDSSGFPENGFLPEQKLSRLEAMKGMTIWAAFAQFEEKEKGSIDIGKKANFVISEINLLKCDENDILGARILRTIINGESVFIAD